MTRDPRLRYAAYAALYFFWGTTFLGIRVAVQHGFPPFILSALRHGSAGLILLGLARGRGTALPKPAEMLGAALMGICFLALANGTCAWAMQSVESGYATLVIAGVPLAALAYGALFRGQAARRAEWGLVLLGLAGVALLLSPKAAQGHSSSPWGLLALVAATLIWSITMVEKGRFAQPTDPLMLTAFQMLGGGAALLLLSLPTERPSLAALRALPQQAWLAWAYLVVFGSCVGYGAFSYLLSVDPPARVGTYSYVNPVVAVSAGHLVLGEVVSPVILASSALILASVAGLLMLKPHADEGEQP
jgi:drug/metabolite transporter (DMT)-like permease